MSARSVNPAPVGAGANVTAVLTGAGTGKAAAAPGSGADAGAAASAAGSNGAEAAASRASGTTQPAQQFSSALAAAGRLGERKGPNAVNAQASTKPGAAAGSTAAAAIDNEAIDDEASAALAAAVDVATGAAPPATIASSTATVVTAAAGAAPASGKAGKTRASGSDGSASNASELAALALLLAAGAASLGADSALTDSSEQPMDGGSAGAVASQGSGSDGNASVDSGVDAAALAAAAPVTGVPGRLISDKASETVGTAVAAAGSAATAAPTDGAPAVSANAAGLPQLLHNLADISSMTAAVTTGDTRSIAVPVTDPSWPQAVAAQIRWLANSQIQSATLRLSPEHLGPLEVHLDVRQQQVNVSFSASHADTRNALAEAVPRLRELLAAGGLTLGQATVQQEPRSGPRSQAAAARNAAPVPETAEPVASAGSRILGLVDEYA